MVTEKQRAYNKVYNKAYRAAHPEAAEQNRVRSAQWYAEHPEQARGNSARWHAAHPLHVRWGAMIDRCTNPKSKGYARYGGRGIKVCKRWLVFKNYEADIATLGPRPSPAHTLDRINNDGNYTLKNMRWASPSQQSRNQRHPERDPGSGRWRPRK
jgi:hypothetical protein